MVYMTEPAPRHPAPRPGRSGLVTLAGGAFVYVTAETLPWG